MLTDDLVGSFTSRQHEHKSRMFYRRQQTMVMGVFLNCVAHCMDLATRPPGHLHVSLVFYFVANVQGDRSRSFDTDAGGGVAAGAGADEAVAGAGDGTATGTNFGMRT